MKRFLIRKTNQEILGPMSITEFSDSREKMRIVDSDEVCGNLGDWIFLHQKDRLRNIYPEIFKSIYDENLVQSNAKIVSENQIESSSQTKPSRFKNKKSDNAILEYVIASIFVIGVGVFFLINKKKVMQPAPVNGELVDLYRESVSRYAINWENASLFVSERPAMFIETMRKDQTSWERLIPYVRLYAFTNGAGVFGDLTPSQLKGREVSIPCQMPEWNAMFKDNTKIFRQFDVKDPIARSLMIDINWLQSRWTEGWLLPQGLEAACMLLGESAFKTVYGQKSGDAETEAISRRFNRFREKVLGQKNFPVLTNHPLDILSCVEESLDGESVKGCIPSNIKNEWKPFFEVAGAVNLVRRGIVIPGNLPISYPITGLTLQPEIKLLEELKIGKDLSSASKVVQEQFPEFINIED